jgi:hypothetical protein
MKKIFYTVLIVHFVLAVMAENYHWSWWWGLPTATFLLFLLFFKIDVFRL